MLHLQALPLLIRREGLKGVKRDCYSKDSSQWIKWIQNPDTVLKHNITVQKVPMPSSERRDKSPWQLTDETQNAGLPRSNSTCSFGQWKHHRRVPGAYNNDDHWTQELHTLVLTPQYHSQFRPLLWRKFSTSRKWLRLFTLSVLRLVQDYFTTCKRSFGYFSHWWSFYSEGKNAMFAWRARNNDPLHPISLCSFSA